MVRCSGFDLIRYRGFDSATDSISLDIGNDGSVLRRNIHPFIPNPVRVLDAGSAFAGARLRVMKGRDLQRATAVALQSGVDRTDVNRAGRSGTDLPVRPSGIGRSVRTGQ